MSMRLIFMVLGAFLGFKLRSSGTGWPALGSAKLVWAASAAALSLLLLASITVGVEQFLSVLPLHAGLLGFFVGYFLLGAASKDGQARDRGADQGGKADRDVGAISAPRGGGEQPSRPSPAAEGARDTGSNWQVWPVLGLGFVLVGIVSPADWGRFTDRLTSIKAPGVELTLLGTAAGESVAHNIRVAATPGGPINAVGGRDRHGFIEPRLERMLTLTQPYRLDPGMRSGATLASNPTAFLYGYRAMDTLPEAGTRAHGRPALRDLQRDRAMLLHLARGRNAVDTRERVQSPTSSFLQQQIENLGAVQEDVLGIIAPHVSCLREVVRLTSDRRLLEYQTARVVERLSYFNRLWWSLEYMEAERALRTGTYPSSPANPNAVDQLKHQAKLLTEALDGFSDWARRTVDVWTLGPLEASVAAIVSPAATPPPADDAQGDNALKGLARDEPTGEDPRPRRTEGGARGDRDRKPCAKRAPNSETIQSYVSSMDWDAFRNGGFTPYLTMFVSQALSAVDDHDAALRMLLDWQNRLNELADVARNARATTVWFEPPPVSVVNDALPNNRIGVLSLTFSWYQLTAFVETIIVQEQSDNTDHARPPTEAGLSHLVKRLFPEVLARIAQGTDLAEWTGKTRDCREPSLSWRQSLVLSYVRWLKSHLDLRNKNAITPGSLTSDDYETAGLIGRINLECFPDMLRDELSIIRQRAHFAVSAAATKLNLLVGDRLGRNERQSLRVSLTDAMRRTVAELERSQLENRPMPIMDELVFGRERLLLNSARSIAARLDQLPPN